jgi:hypothetical protein
LVAGNFGFSEVSSLEVASSEVGSWEVGFLEEGSSDVGSSEVGFVKIETSTVFLGYASLHTSEHVQDRLNVSSRTACPFLSVV